MKGDHMINATHAPVVVSTHMTNWEPGLHVPGQGGQHPHFQPTLDPMHLEWWHDSNGNGQCYNMADTRDVTAHDVGGWHAQVRTTS